MSIRLIMACYALCILATISAFSAVVRSGLVGHRLKWVNPGLWCALLGVLLFAGQPYIPEFFSVVLANVAFLITFVLLHQAIAAVLQSSRRYIGLSALLVLVQFFGFLYYTYSVPDIRTRILLRTVAIAIQVSCSAWLLLQRQDCAAMRPSQRIAGWTLATFVMFQIARIFATCIWTPSSDPFHLDPVQAFFSSFNFVLGLFGFLVVIWLGLSEQRDNLHLMATTDGLSGLMNRRAFDEALAREIEDANRQQEPVALLMIDLDHFKEINDRFGHQTGDEVIRRVSRLLCVNTRTTDAVARYGGEEFAMILPGMQLNQAQSIAERLRTQIEAMAGLPESLRVTASIGIAIAGVGDTGSSLVHRSDKALYRSKNDGRNRVCVQYAYSES